MNEYSHKTEYSQSFEFTVLVTPVAQMMLIQISRIYIFMCTVFPIYAPSLFIFIYWYISLIYIHTYNSAYFYLFTCYVRLFACFVLFNFIQFKLS